MNEEEYKEIIRPLTVGIIVLAILFALSFCWLRHNRSRDGEVGERIDTATKIVTESRNEQQAITSGAESAAREAESIREAINQSDKQAIRVEREIESTGEAISECRASIERCQQLIRRIQERAEPDAK